MSSSNASTPGRVIREVALPTPDGVLRGKVGVTAGPMRLAGLVRTAFELTNALVARAADLERQAGREISCRAGCGACCRHMVPLSPPEAFHIVDVLESLAAPRRAEATTRFAEITATLERESLVGDLLDPPPTELPYLPAARRYFELKMACPFLVDESCGIHADRPVACRDYNVTSPAIWCTAPYGHDIAKLPMPMPLCVPLSRLTAKLTGDAPRLIPLTLAPAWVAEHAELRQRRWPGPELFDRFLAEIGAGSTGAAPTHGGGMGLL